MYDAELDAVAAEYVLGTLAADERAHANSLLLVDPDFVEIVHQWERRLGELNVMVEAVEPPPEIWDKIKAEIKTLAPGEQVRLAPVEQSAAEEEAAAKSEQKTEVEAGAKSADENSGGEQSTYLSALASSLLTSEGEAKPEGEESEKPEEKTEAELETTLGAEPTQAGPLKGAKPPRNADVFYLARRIRRWRRIALFSGLIAVLLALAIAASQIEPDLFGAAGLSLPQLFSFSSAPAASQRNSFVAVLQQDPVSPAFLLTLDAASRTLSVRRVAAAAKADTGRAYQLWAIATPSSRPRSLGLVGASEFTQRPLPADFNLNAMRNAQYEISYEPAAGSRTGVPSGPVLFRGKLVESVPPAPPPPAGSQPADSQ